MTQDHEYAVIGHNRAKVGKHLGTLAAALASGGVLLAGALLEFSQKFGIVTNVPAIVFWPLTAGLTFAGVHFAFNRYAWKWRWIVACMGLPDLSGTWSCKGQTLDMDCKPTYDWEGVITITQTWEKIWVSLKTDQSISRSQSAALIREPDGSFRLMYNYNNDPKMGEKELTRHVGFTELLFSPDLKTAEGDYFNNKGRYTFGKMKLQRRKK